MFGKKRHWLKVYSLSVVFFVCVRRNKSGNLALRMTGVADTHLTLAAIPFQVEVNNKFFVIKNKREKICRVFVPVESVIPCPHPI